jgi:uncharacterized protein YkwD
MPTSLWPLAASLLALSILAHRVAPSSAADPRTVLRAPELLMQVNRFRVQNDLRPVVRHATLDRVAQSLADDLALSGQLQHTDRLGRTLRFRVAGAGYRYRMVVENLARGQPSAERVLDDWLASVGHRSNLLQAEVRHVGIGVTSAVGISYPELVWVLVLAEPFGAGAGEPLLIDVDQGRMSTVPLN